MSIFATMPSDALFRAYIDLIFLVSHNENLV